VASCTILGGANGSGKSTIYEKLHLEGVFVNADLAAREISPGNPESVTGAAGRRVLKRLNQLLAATEDFTYETTLSSHQSLNLMERATAAGYSVNLVFVVLRDLELNVLRVAQRVMRGGHSIPEHVIRRRYEASFKKLPRAISLARQVIVYDNSNPVEFETLIEILDGSIVSSALDESNPLHCRIAECVGSALNLGVDAVFKAAKPA
jgi:predicted ABC-type ATPase